MTRTPVSFNSVFNANPRLVMANLLAEYGTPPSSSARTPATDETFTTSPSPRSPQGRGRRP